MEGIIDFEPNKDPLETTDMSWAERVQFKSTLSFVKQMDQYMDELSHSIFEAAEYRFGQFTVASDWICTRFMAYKSYPIKRRLLLIANDIHQDFISSNFMNDDVPKKTAILKALRQILTFKNSLSLYKNFYKWLNCPHLFMLPDKHTLEWSDVFPFLYLHRAMEGLKESTFIKHLVIDEMQDYTPIQYTVINYLKNQPGGSESLSSAGSRLSIAADKPRACSF